MLILKVWIILTTGSTCAFEIFFFMSWMFSRKYLSGKKCSHSEIKIPNIPKDSDKIFVKLNTLMLQYCIAEC